MAILENISEKMIKQMTGATAQAKNFIRKYGNYSGSGSTLEATEQIREFLPKICKEYNVQILLDAPCGDCSWIKEVDFGTVTTYIGYDIVDFVIEKAKKNMTNNIFKIDIVNPSALLPFSNLILSRDFLFHLSFEDGLKVIQNFKKSGAPYLMSTSFKSVKENKDFSGSEKSFGYGWRAINLEIEPYNLGEPIEYIREHVRGNSDTQKVERIVGLWGLTNSI